jgi:hypothetical protein
LTNDPFLRPTSDSVLGHKQYREGGAPGLKEVNFAFGSRAIYDVTAVDDRSTSESGQAQMVQRTPASWQSHSRAARSITKSRCPS